jgi:hypothetical protein
MNPSSLRIDTARYNQHCRYASAIRDLKAFCGIDFSVTRDMEGNFLALTGKEQTMGWGTRRLQCAALVGLLLCAPLAVAAQSTTLILPITGTVNGGTFAGTLTLTELTVSIAGQLVASGMLEGTVTATDGSVTPVSQTFTGVVIDLTNVLRGPE